MTSPGLAEFISPLSEASSGVTPGVVSVYASTDIEVTPLAIKPSISVVVRPQSAHLSLKAAWDFRMPAIASRGSRRKEGGKRNYQSARKYDLEKTHPLDKTLLFEQGLPQTKLQQMNMFLSCPQEAPLTSRKSCKSDGSRKTAVVSNGFHSVAVQSL